MKSDRTQSSKSARQVATLLVGERSRAERERVVTSQKFLRFRCAKWFARTRTTAPEAVALPNPVATLNRGTFALAVFFSLLFTLVAHAQNATIKGWHSDIRDPDTGKLKFFIAGEQATPDLKSRRMLLRGTTITNFDAAGGIALIVHAPEAAFNLEDSSISSAGAIDARSGNGQFTITGSGFVWSQSKTNSALVISNDVRTIIRKELIKSATADSVTATNQAVEVLSKRFEFDPKSNVAIFKENVRATEPERLKLNCDLLTARLPADGGRLESILAEQHVVMDLADNNGDLHAEGAKAEYALGRESEDSVRITGEPTWRTKLFAGRGDVLTLNSRKKEFAFNARGHATVTMPRSALAQGALGSTNVFGATNSSASTNGFVEIASENYDFTPGRATFRGDVRVNNEPDWRLRCDELVVGTSPAANKVEKIQADRHVVIEMLGGESAGEATAEHAIYTLGTNNLELVELTGQPRWHTKRYEGRGERLALNPRSKQFSARGNAALKLFAAPGTQLNSSSSPVKSSSSEAFEIFADAYELNASVITFHDRVRVEHPEWKLACALVIARLGATNNAVESIHAERNVVLTQTELGAANRRPAKPDANSPAQLNKSIVTPWKLTCDEMDFQMATGGGQIARIAANKNVIVEQSGIRATGDEAIYEPNTEKIRLQKQARLVTPDGKIVTGSAINFNGRKNSVEVEGYTLEIPAAALRKSTSTTSK
ncbi:MAG: hypothetical protein HY043_13640 [Verrucomicrobia bacterium]|nr:hypothetical protein [Verrucomicrobiota bacterium]